LEIIGFVAQIEPQVLKFSRKHTTINRPGPVFGRLCGRKTTAIMTVEKIILLLLA
jgi:hypothetical protein